MTGYKIRRNSEFRSGEQFLFIFIEKHEPNFSYIFLPQVLIYIVRKKFFVARYTTILNYFLHIKVTRLLSELSKIALFVDEKLGQQRLTMRPNLFWSHTWIFIFIQEWKSTQNTQLQWINNFHGDPLSWAEFWFD